jgi:hypothetical protein
MRVRALTTWMILGVVVACGGEGRSGFDGPREQGGGFEQAPASPPAMADDVREVFGHSASTLYRLDPGTKDVVVVGDFRGCKNVIDIALDETGALYGTAFHELYTIDKTTAVCSLVAEGNYPNSLSFVPKGTVSATEEALVGYEMSDYVVIDKKTGAVQKIGSLGSDYHSSGDIVSVKGGKTFLTVKDARLAGECTQYDCLVEVDPSTGAFRHNWGSIQHRNVFGLSFWGGNLYGFDDAGELFEVTLSGAGLTTKSIAIPGNPRDLEFWGAGSSTAAPLLTPH